MNQALFESGLHILEKRYSYGYRIKYVGYIKDKKPLYQIQRRLFGWLWYKPCKKTNGNIAEFSDLSRCLEFINEHHKGR